MTGTTSPRGLVLPRYPRPAAEDMTPVGFPDYRSTGSRAPLHAPVDLPQRLTEVTGPLLGEGRVTEVDADLTAQAEVEPMGVRSASAGRGYRGRTRPPGEVMPVMRATYGRR